MNFAILMMLILTTRAELVKKPNISPLCDLNQCEGYYKLESHEVKKPNIGVTKTKIKLTEGVKSVEIGYVNRKWLTIYCYDGSSIDPNTGCYEVVTQVNPNCSELKRWLKEDVCPTGWECRPDGDCVGENANVKCYDNKTIRSQRGPKLLKWEGTRYMSFAQHTCVSSWECNKFSSTLPTFAKYVDDKPSWVFYDKDNKEYQLTAEMVGKGMNGLNKELICLLDDIKNPIIHILEAECYAETKDDIKCIITQTGGFKGLVFDVSNTGFGILRNMIFEVLGPLLVPEGNKLTDLNINKYGTMGVDINILVDRQRTVNVETAHELALGANILQMQSIYNILSLAQEVDELYNMVILLIKSQSNSDMRLISKIMGLQNFASKWINEEIFEKCKCLRDEMPTNTNCADNKMYQFGSYVEMNDVSKCFHIPEDVIKNISLTDKAALEVDYIKYLPPQTASIDSSAWDTLNDYRNSLISEDREQSSYESLNVKLGLIEKLMDTSAFQKYFLYSTYFISWLTFSLMLLNAVKRN